MPQFMSIILMKFIGARAVCYDTKLATATFSGLDLLISHLPILLKILIYLCL